MLKTFGLHKLLWDRKTSAFQSVSEKKEFIEEESKPWTTLLNQDSTLEEKQAIYSFYWKWQRMNLSRSHFTGWSCSLLSAHLYRSHCASVSTQRDRDVSEAALKTDDLGLFDLNGQVGLVLLKITKVHPY